MKATYAMGLQLGGEAFRKAIALQFIDDAKKKLLSSRTDL